MFNSLSIYSGGHFCVAWSLSPYFLHVKHFRGLNSSVCVKPSSRQRAKRRRRPWASIMPATIMPWKDCIMHERGFVVLQYWINKATWIHCLTFCKLVKVNWIMWLASGYLVVADAKLVIIIKHLLSFMFLDADAYLSESLRSHDGIKVKTSQESKDCYLRIVKNIFIHDATKPLFYATQFAQTKY